MMVVMIWYAYINIEWYITERETEYCKRCRPIKKTESGYIPINKPFNGSGGIPISGSYTFHDAQHILAGSFLNLSVLHCEHSLSLAPIFTFIMSVIFKSGPKSKVMNWM